MKDFDKWFYKVIDVSLINTLEAWQMTRVKDIVKKAIKKGKQISKKITK